jgi:hypothetical protein
MIIIEALKKMVSFTKKGQVSVENVPNLIVILIVVGVVIGMGALIFDRIQDNQLETGTTINESIDVSGINTSKSLISSRIKSNSQVVVATNSSLSNETGVIVSNTTLALIEGDEGTGNYTFNDDLGQISVHSRGLNKSRLLINYSFEQYNTGYNVTEDSKAGLQTFGDFQSVIAIILSAGVILGLIIFLGIMNR